MKDSLSLSLKIQIGPNLNPKLMTLFGLGMSCMIDSYYEPKSKFKPMKVSYLGLGTWLDP